MSRISFLNTPSTLPLVPEADLVCRDSVEGAVPTRPSPLAISQQAIGRNAVSETAALGRAETKHLTLRRRRRPMSATRRFVSYGGACYWNLPRQPFPRSLTSWTRLRSRGFVSGDSSTCKGGGCDYAVCGLLRHA